MDKMLDLKYQAEMPEIRTLLKDYFNQYMSKQSPNSFKTNQNRCFSAIPSVPIYMKDLGAKFNKYRYGNWIVQSMLKREYAADHSFW